MTTMVRGTTPRINIKLKNFDVSLLSDSGIYVTFKQNRYANKTLEKSGSDVIVDEKENLLKVSLSQTDTLYFCGDADVEMQIRALTKSGAAVASKIVKVPVYRILKDGVIK